MAFPSSSDVRQRLRIFWINRTPPDPDTPLQTTDTLLVAGRDENLRRIAEMD